MPGGRRGLRRVGILRIKAGTRQIAELTRIERRRATKKLLLLGLRLGLGRGRGLIPEGWRWVIRVYRDNVVLNRGIWYQRRQAIRP